MEESTEDPDNAEDTPVGRWWQQLAGACEWAFDTFRGHSGMDDLRDRER